MKILKNTISTFLALALTFNILLFQVLLLANRRAVQPDFYLNKFEDYQLYDDLEYYLTQTIEDLIKNEKIAEKLADGVVDRRWIASQSEVFLRGMHAYLTGQTPVLPVIDYGPVVLKLTNNIDDIIKDVGIKNNLIEGMIISTVRENIDTALPLAPFSSEWDELKRQKFIASLEKPRWIFTNIIPALYISGALILITLVLLLAINRKSSLYFKYLSTSMFLGGAMACTLSLLALGTSGSFIHNLVLKGLIPVDVLQYMPSLKLVVESIIKGLAYPLLAGGLASIGIGVLLIVIFKKIIVPES